MRLTLSNDRHPAGPHSVIGGMMEVFGDCVAKISQNAGWAGERCSVVLVDQASVPADLLCSVSEGNLAPGCGNIRWIAMARGLLDSWEGVCDVDDVLSRCAWLCRGLRVTPTPATCWL